MTLKKNGGTKWQNCLPGGAGQVSMMHHGQFSTAGSLRVSLSGLSLFESVLLEKLPLK
jgi:hypothetical protein